MESEAPPLEIFFFPFVGGGHLIPMIDLARLFAVHGVKSTIVAPPSSTTVFHKTIQRDQESGLHITLHTVHLPDSDHPHPITSLDMSAKPMTETTILQEPVKKLLQERKPDCLVSDSFHSWAASLASELGIRRIGFQGSCCFSQCAQDSIRRYKPHEKVASDSDPFVLPDLPDHIELTRSQLPFGSKAPSGTPRRSSENQENTYGILVNSFLELEPNYVKYFKEEMGKRAWLVGPVSLCNTSAADKADRGQDSIIDQHSCLSWLDSKEPNSVLYISFGSLVRLAQEQIHEIAHGLEASNCSFLWVIGKVIGQEKGSSEVLPDGFEERIMRSQKGQVIKGWAPQLLILEHKSIGGFLTHCGWNSVLEAVTVGVPMVTWPLSAEQFYNEKLITDVLRIGVKVGSEEWRSWNQEPKTLVRRERVAAVAERLMSGDDVVVEMRKKAKEFGEKAKRAVKEGGSSFNDALALIEELKSFRK
ncbi:UDP-glucuronosyl/UDP-glucosyltransferase [Dillenia turbinata]|uniref:Glycosyltransferase n=1 Tax=Dillenia turbinata TaxID=194707 RepID=A0AAN8WCH0_9MAGN